MQVQLSKCSHFLKSSSKTAGHLLENVLSRVMLTMSNLHIRNTVRIHEKNVNLNDYARLEYPPTLTLTRKWKPRPRLPLVTFRFMFGCLSVHSHATSPWLQDPHTGRITFVTIEPIIASNMLRRLPTKKYVLEISEPFSSWRRVPNFIAPKAMSIWG